MQIGHAEPFCLPAVSMNPAFSTFRAKPGATLLAVVIVLALSVSAQAAGRKLFTNSLAPMPANVAKALQAPTARHLAEKVEIEVPLQMRDYPKLIERLGRGGIVPHEVLEQNHLPLPADYDRLLKWLKAEGFTITRTDSSRLSVFAKGTVAQVQQSFQVQMAHMTLAGREYHVARTHPSLPADVGAPVLGINGLQPYARLIKRSTTTANAPPYLVNEIKGAYNATGLGVTGAGQTIAIIIDTVPLNSDLTSFWTNNNVAQSLSNIQTINVSGDTLDSPSGEETLDVEWSSGVAPGAKVRVYAAGSLAFTDVDKALQQVINDLPSQPGLHQMSISLGLGETYLASGSQMQTDAQYFASLASAGVSVFVSSGDAGSNPNSSGGTGGPLQVEYYSSDPSVTGVGGTSLTLNTSTGAVSSETAWTSSGGGTSITFSRPSWQKGTGVTAGSFRLVPDVSLAADPNKGAYLFLNGSAEQVGGTSWSAPAWAGFCALINEARANASKTPVGLLNPLIYPLIGTANFRDITSGSNGQYSAGTGYDRVTGIGVPNVSALIQTLTTPAPVIASFSPPNGLVGATVTITGSYFTGASTVSFNGTEATNFTVDSATQITAVVPTGASIGPISVTTSGGTASSSSNFVVLPSSIPNDLYMYAQAISGNSGSVTGTNAGATKETGEPNHAGNAGGSSIWYSWTAPAGGGVYTFDTLGSSFDTLLGVYTGTSVSSLTQVVANDDAGTAVTSAVSFQAVGGTTYSIAVDGHGGASGNVVLNWTLNSSTPTINSFSPSIGGVGTTVVINGASYTGATSVAFNGTPAAFTVISPTQINATVPAGTTTGPVTLTTPSGSVTSAASFTFIIVPVNDTFANATNLGTADGVFTGNNIGATKETGEPSHAGNAGGASVWWKWTAPYAGTFSLSTQGSSFDTLLAVYTGSSVSSLSAVASNDNDPAGGTTSALSFGATAGTVYYIAVDGSGGATGNIVLTVNPISTTATLFTTGFETSEGYPSTGKLSGVKSWTSTGSGGNGFTNGAFSGQGQQAYVGLTAPTSPDTSLSVWQPLNYTPATGDVATFSISTAIIDSTGRTSTRHYDLFRWEVWNLSGQRLFSFEFNNATNAISYILDDGLGPQATSATLANSHIYSLVITMNFTAGTWSASLDGGTVVTNQPMTTTGSALNVGGIRANWTQVDTKAGNNYMLFDNYKFTAASLVPPHFSSQPLPLSVAPGASASFSAVASGTPVISYQWRKDGTPISHATGSSYSIASVKSIDVGGYDVVATSTAGTAISTAAQLTVLAGNFNVTTSALPAIGGATTGDGTYTSSTTATVVATPAAGFNFVSWTNGGTVVSTSPSYTFAVTSDATLVANFSLPPFAAWKSQWFTAAELADPSISGDDADPDGDGLPNIVEYALGLNPRVPNSSTVLTSSVTNGVLTATYQLSKAATDVTVVVEESSDLINWNSGTTFISTPQVLTDDGTTQTVQVTDKQSSGSSHRFMRLRVTSP